MAAPSATPVEDLIRERLSTLQPTRLDIANDSHAHAHHAGMAGRAPSAESHFRLAITSAAFSGLRQPARHRMVYALLQDELQRDGGIHALQLRTLTPEEAAAKEAAAAAATDEAVGCKKGE
ncbi:bola-like protein [Niveomyces insectorum RCEF 264]|uniref:Bola-like protein n=1 Tax=Niveomyces insectorum RCEF 264 TaxID=1081102 RepID=A0A167UZC5_9HYPO|nr:bola-like protein [Niveomyces insectorum RCEF 264]